MNLDKLADKIHGQKSGKRNFSHVKDVDELLSRIPSLVSSICQSCPWKGTCPFFKADSVCIIVSEAMGMADRRVGVVQSRYKKVYNDFIASSSLLTTEQRSEDLTKAMLFPALLSRLSKDLMKIKAVIAVEEEPESKRKRHPLLAQLFTSRAQTLDEEQLFFKPFEE